MNGRMLFHVLALMVLLGLAVVPLGSAQSRPGPESDPTALLTNAALPGPGERLWHTFLGGLQFDIGRGMAVDANGNIYVCGFSYGPWGTPISPLEEVHTSSFVAKLNSNGVLLWNTFLGSGSGSCNDMAVDGSGNIYLAGTSLNTWGTPVNPFAGGEDAYFAKLNSNGVLLWNTFMGGGGEEYMDFGEGVAVDANGNVYVIGYIYENYFPPYGRSAEWGDEQAFVARLKGSSGALVWSAFLGGENWDEGNDIAVDGNGNIYIAGTSVGSWGWPLNPGEGAFVAKLNSSGALLWNTFMDRVGWAGGKGIAVDESGNIYLTGESIASWGTPVNPYAGFDDAYVAKLNSSGARLWNTFLGGSESDEGRSIAVDGNRNVYVTGLSWGGWGTMPINPHAGGYDDAYIAKLDSTGALTWHTFLGGSDWDVGNGIAVASSRNLYVMGTSRDGWGTPLDPYAGDWDTFVAKLATGSTPSSRAFRSIGVHDGWVLESSETSLIGGSMDASAVTFNLGDDAGDRQYRAILSFDTSALPDTAVIERAVLKIKRQGGSGTNPFTTHMGLKVDIRKPYFGPSAVLAVTDFQARASKPSVATFYKTPTADWWHTAVLSAAAYPYINLTGTTQFRLRFYLDDNDDLGADYLKIFSGNAYNTSYRPALVIEYTVP